MPEPGPFIQQQPQPRSRRGRFALISIFFLLVIVFGIFSLRSIFTTPKDFPLGSRVVIAQGQSLGSIADTLAHAHIINSSIWFKLAVTFSSGERTIKAGEYLFDAPLDTLHVIGKLTRGEYGFSLVKVTIPEGYSVHQIAGTLSSKLDTFPTEDFIANAKDKEGYLFPETYTFATNEKPAAIIEAMSEQFVKKTQPLTEDILKSGHPLADIITMASLLEEEAKTTESRAIVSGILWNRIALGMPLQVDASFLYVNGKNTYELTREDLNISSPYNTYKNKGLPPTPISNPGLDSILAAIHPKKTPYLYYLSERDGTMHYAKTYAEHLKNKALYLGR